MDKKQVKKSVTLAEIISWYPCGLHGDDDGKNYTPQRLERLMAGRERVTPRDAVVLYESGEISLDDCLWFLLRFLTDEQMSTLTCNIAQEVIDEYGNDDPRLQNVIDTKRRWIHGEVTYKELRKAWLIAVRMTVLAKNEAEIVAARAATWAVGRMTVEMAWLMPGATEAIRESQIAMILAATENNPNTESTEKQTGEEEQK